MNLFGFKIRLLKRICISEVSRISIEGIICLENHPTSATYYVDNLKLSTLLLDIVQEATRNVLDSAKIHLLMYALSHIPFIQEEQVVEIIDKVINCLQSQSFSMFLHGKFTEIQRILEIDYEINGSFIVSEENEPNSYLDITILLPN